MSFLKNEAAFDPQRDGKIPIRRGPIALAVRLVLQVLQLGFSRHPMDLPRWIWSMLRRRRPLSYALPWLTFDAIRALEAHARPGHRVFEFGSGHSTVYWARKDVELHSVEDDSGWFEMVKENLCASPDVHLYFEKGQDAYVGRLGRTEGDFDVIVVDGSFRKACISAATGKLRPGGLLVVDNTDWHWFASADGLVPPDWRKSIYPGFAPFIGHASETTIWTRP
jgi:hypothetical protein